MGIRITWWICFLGTLAAALILTPLVGRFARRWEIVDHPNSRKIHRTPIPRIGGVGIAAAMLAVFVPVLLFSPAVSVHGILQSSQLTTLLGAVCFILLVGLADDVFNLPARYKLIALLAASVALCAAGIRVHSLQISRHYFIPLELASWPITILWVIGITVSINFIDGLDGLAAGIVAIAAAVLAVSAHLARDYVVVALAICLLGSLCGFLYYNFNPAKIFMGDSGSMFIGFTLASATMLCADHAGTTIGLLVPGIALVVPLMDVLLTVIRRSVLERRSLFSAERGHIHHNLLDQGLSQLQAVLLLYALTLVAAGVGLAVLFWGGWTMIGSLCILIVSTGFIFRFAGSTRLHETIAAMRRNRALGRESRRYREAFEEQQTRFRAVAGFASWWEQLCSAAEMFDFIAITLPLTNRDGTSRVLHWRHAESALDKCETARVTLPIPQRRGDGPLRAEVEVAAATYLESAGQRIALFSRLVCDYGLTQLSESGGGSPAGLDEAGESLMAPALVGGPRRVRSRRPPAVLAPAALRAPELSRLTVAPPAAPQAARAPALPPPPLPAPTVTGPRVAIVHDFLYVYAGAEKVVEQIIEIYPDADLFALFDFLPDDQRGFLRGKPVATSFLQRMPLARRMHRAYLPLMPLAIEQLDVSAYDIVISSSYVAAKGIITGPKQTHVCYCHTPARFAWDLQNQYLGKGGLLRSLHTALARVLLHYIRQWDTQSANRVDVFVTNSDFVSARIRKTYRRESRTIYPPVETQRFTLQPVKEDFYLTASRMVPYKRIDLIIDAFAQMPSRKLVVVGDGPEYDKLAANLPPNVRLVGHQPFERLRQYMQMARAFVFAAEEDFGIAPVEAQACGTPVIAYAQGGVTESVIPGRTGVFFPAQTAASIVGAIHAFEAGGPWDAWAIRENAERFSAERFRAEFRDAVETAWTASLAQLKRSAATPEVLPPQLVANLNKPDVADGASARS